MIKQNQKVRKLLYRVRDLRSKQLFSALEKYGSGAVLDVGGGSFYATGKTRLANAPTE